MEVCDTHETILDMGIMGGSGDSVVGKREGNWFPSERDCDFDCPPAGKPVFSQIRRIAIAPAFDGRFQMNPLRSVREILSGNTKFPSASLPSPSPLVVLELSSFAR